MPDIYPPHTSIGACPHCGLRECGHDWTTHQGPFVEAPIKTSGSLPPERAQHPLPVRVPGETGAYDHPVEPPPVTPLPTQAVIERVLAPIEARAKRRKKPEQGSLW